MITGSSMPYHFWVPFLIVNAWFALRGFRRKDGPPFDCAAPDLTGIVLTMEIKNSTFIVTGGNRRRHRGNDLVVSGNAIIADVPARAALATKLASAF